MALKPTRRHFKFLEDTSDVLYTHDKKNMEHVVRRDGRVFKGYCYNWREELPKGKVKRVSKSGMDNLNALVSYRAVLN